MTLEVCQFPSKHQYLPIFLFLTSFLTGICQDAKQIGISNAFYVALPGSSKISKNEIFSSQDYINSSDSESNYISFGYVSESPLTGISSKAKIKFGEVDKSPISKKDNSNEEPKLGIQARTYALLLAINNYQFSSSDLKNLSNPIKDANSLKSILTDKYTFDNNNIFLLTNPTREQILGQLEDLAKKITDKDNLLIFYAGHGYWDERLKVGYWLPNDSKIDNKANWIANSTIRDYIAGIQSKHTLLISDACFSGSIFKSRELNNEINQYAVAKIYQLPSRKAMTSGTLTIVPDDSKFMNYLLKRLQQNSDKYLTSRQLFNSLEAAVLNNTSSVPQFGVIQETGDEGGDFIFILRDGTN